MRTGFYNVGDIDSKLQNLDISGSGSDAYQYFHGCCDEFALALNDIFGYEVVLWTEIDEQSGLRVLVHAFTQFNLSGETYYVDIRGITDDILDIVSEFEYCHKPKFTLCKDRNEALKILSSMGICNFTTDNEPQEIIKKYREYYIINKK